MNSFCLKDEEYRLISGLVYDKFGISLGEHKRTLVVERLQRELRTGGFTSFMEYYRHVIEDQSGRALLTLVDRLSTNHTFFFRERSHFDFFMDEVLPGLTESLKKKGRQDIKIWCAGCSSGEEPYTLAMILYEYFGPALKNTDARILATDISVSVLEKAEDGIYSENHMSQVPFSYRQKYFRRLRDGRWAVSQDLKNMVLFRRLNLMRPEYPFKGRFQAVFCRNVMIYFDDPTRKGLVERFHRSLEPGGHLFIGHSESLGRDNQLFRYIKPAVYQKL